MTEPDQPTGAPARPRVGVQRPEPEVIRDPALLKALAHPMRRRILRHLALEQSANSTTLARVLGESTGTTSYHLRQLQRHGLVEEIPEQSAGRERWWRAVSGPRDVRLPDPSTLTPREREAHDVLAQTKLAEDLELLIRFAREYPRLLPWATGSRGMLWLTEGELRSFLEEYIDLLFRYSRERDQIPDDARPMLMRFFAMPADEA